MGNFRQTPLRDKHFDHYNNGRFEAVATGMCGWRKYMEDAHICDIDIGGGNSLFAVFDGHGGPEISDQVSRIFVQHLLANQNYGAKNYELALTETFMKVDEWLQTEKGVAEVKQRKTEHQSKNNASSELESDAGCTAVVCLVTADQVYCANAGDSRCFLGKQKQAITMSEDHKPDNPEEVKRIKAAGGQVIEGRVNGNLNLSRAIGDFEYKNIKDKKWDEQLIISKPDIIKKPLAGVEYIVLGCDGLFEVKSNQEIYDLIIADKQRSLEATVTSVLDGLLAKDTQGHFGLDNMTMMLVKLK